VLSTASGQAGEAGSAVRLRTAKNRRTDRKTNKFVFRLACGFSIARKLAGRHASFRRKLLGFALKPVRPVGFQRDEIPLAQVWARGAPNVPPVHFY